MKNELLKLKYFLFRANTINRNPFNHEEIVVAIGIIIKPILLNKDTLITILKITEINEKKKGVLVSFLANIKLENIFIIENAGRPNAK